MKCGLKEWALVIWGELKYRSAPFELEMHSLRGGLSMKNTL